MTGCTDTYLHLFKILTISSFSEARKFLLVLLPFLYHLHQEYHLADGHKSLQVPVYLSLLLVLGFVLFSILHLPKDLFRNISSYTYITISFSI